MNTPQPQRKAQSFKEVTQAHFDDICLTDDEVSRLQDVLAAHESPVPHDDISHDSSREIQKPQQNDTPERQVKPDVNTQPTAPRMRPVTWYGFGLAASVMLAVILVWQQLQPVSSKADISYLIAKEVAKNHMKLKPLEVSSGNFSKVSSYFGDGKLDFKPMPSAFLKKNNVNTLLGARYCSIQSVTAAQIRYKNDVGKYVTFYEVGYDAEKFGDMPTLTYAVDRGNTVTPTVHYVSGMKVNIWVEKGLLMASVVDAS